MVFSGEPLHRTDLVVATGYQRDTIPEGLQTLEALHLVERMAPYQGWRLTTRLEQLDLPRLFEDESYGKAESSDEGESQEDFDEGEEAEFSAPTYQRSYFTILLKGRRFFLVAPVSAG